MADVRNLSIGVAFDVNDNALSKIDDRFSRLIQSAKTMDAAASAGFLKVTEGANKSAAATKEVGTAAEKTSSQVKAVGEAGTSIGSGIVDGANKATSALTKPLSRVDELKASLKLAGDSGKLIGTGVDSGVTKATSGLQKLIDKAKTVKSAFGSIGSGLQNAGKAAGFGYNGESENKIAGAVKESAAMFAPGFLIANGVMAGAEKVKEAFKKGYEYTSEQSGLSGTWKTLVDGATSEGVSTKQAGSAGGITNMINNQARENARSLDLVNEASQQTYHATDSSARTSHLVQSELRIADAMGLSDDQAKNFAITGVGHAMDLGKVSSQSMNIMSLYSPAVKYALARELAAKDKNEDISKVSEEDQKEYAQKLGGKKGLLAQGAVSSADLEKAVNYLGDTKFKDAAKNAMSTLPGMARSVENGIPRIMSGFENGLMKPMASWGNNIFGKVATWFNSADSQKEAEKFGGNLSKVTQSIFDNATKIGTALAPFAAGFGNGLKNGVKDLQGAWKTVSGIFSDIGKKLSGIISGNPVLNSLFGETKTNGKVVNNGQTTLKKVGDVAGVATVIGLATQLSTKLPLIGGPLQKLLDIAGHFTKLDKVPVIKELFSGKNPFSGKDKALDTNTVALDRLTATIGKQPAAGGLEDKVTKEGESVTKKGESVTKKGESVTKKGESVTKKGAKYEAAAAKYESKVVKYGKDSKQALKAQKSLNKYKGKAGAEADKLSTKAANRMAKDEARYGEGNYSKRTLKSKAKAETALSKVDSIGQRVSSVESKAKGLTYKGARSAEGVVGKLTHFGGGAKGVFGKLGSIGGKAANLFLGDGGEALGKSAGLLGKVKGLAKGSGLLGIGLNAVDLFSAFSQKPGTARNKAVGGSVGGIAGGAIGGALGSLLGPVGTMVGGMAGNAVGNWVGGKIGGSKFGSTVAKNVGSFGKTVGKDFNGFKKWAGQDHLKGVGDSVKKGLSGFGKSSQKDFNMARKGVDQFASTLKKVPIIGKLAAHNIEAINHPVKTMQNNLKASKSVVKGVGIGFDNIGKGAKSAFNKVSSAVTSGMGKAKSTASKEAKNIGSAVNTGLSKVGSSAKSAFNNVSSNIGSGLNKGVSVAKDGASKIKIGISSGLKATESVAKTAMSAFGSAFDSGMSKAKSLASKGVDGIKSVVKSGMDMVKSAVDIGVNAFNKFGSVVSGIIGSVKSAVSGLANAIGNEFKKIASSLGGIHLPHLASGTIGAKSAFNSRGIRAYASGGAHPGGLAKVNDAAGSVWQEAFMLPNGLVGLFPKKRDMVVPLPAGTQVLDAVSTHKKFGNAYAEGTPGASQVFDKLMSKNSLASSSNRTTIQNKNGISIEISPRFNITGTFGTNQDQIQKQVLAIVKPFLEMMAQTLQAKLA
jgi:hypothetical protein